jgi:hypothetical protein
MTTSTAKSARRLGGTQWKSRSASSDAAASKPSKPDVQWRKGWTPWGTPCSVLVVDGFAHSAHAAEKGDCPLGRLDTAS